MTSLARLQRSFQRHVLAGGAHFESEIAGNARLSAKRRLAIYFGAYRARLVEALGTDYPGLQALAGNNRFEQLARQYISAHPSSYRNLRWYGGEFPAFLVKSAPLRRAPALAEMAAFEQQLGLAFDAADAAPVTVEDIARIPLHEWPQIRFTPHPSVRRLTLHYNVPAVHAAALEGKPLSPLRRARHAVPWLIWRQELVTRYRSLAQDEAPAVDALLRGATFGEICAQFTDSSEPGLRAAALLKGWLRESLICGVEGE